MTAPGPLAFDADRPAPLPGPDAAARDPPDQVLTPDLTGLGTGQIRSDTTQTVLPGEQVLRPS
jgi:hypothetical protein